LSNKFIGDKKEKQIKYMAIYQKNNLNIQ
jgi:hypothetical protein